MASEWTRWESAALLVLTALLLAVGYLVSGPVWIVGSVVAVLVFALWLLGASGKLGISAIR